MKIDEELGCVNASRPRHPPVALRRPWGTNHTWLRAIARTCRSHPIAMSAALAIWMLAMVRLLVDPTPRLPVVFNWTASLPYHVALAHYQPQALHRGDFIIYRFDGPEHLRHPGLRGQALFKQIAGVPGDQIQVHGRMVTVAGMAVGTAKTHTFDRKPLQPIEAGVIPPSHYYVRGSSADSFDSRYRSSALVSEDQVIARLTPLF